MSNWHLVTIGAGNGLEPDGDKLLAESMVSWFIEESLRD